MVRFCYGPTNLSLEGVVRCEACVTRPLVEMWSDLVIVRLCYGPSYLTAGHKRTQVAKFTRWKAVDVTVLTGQHVLSKQCPLFLSSLRQCALYDKLIELFEHMHFAHKYRRKWGDMMHVKTTCPGLGRCYKQKLTCSRSERNESKLYVRTG